MYKLTQINIYPVKSLGGVPLTQSLAGGRGFLHDRRWMIVDENHSFLTQREAPLMALVGINLLNDGFTLYCKKDAGNNFTIPYSIDRGSEMEVTIFNDRCRALHYSGKADEWISDMINLKCSLIYMPESTHRYVNNKFSASDIVSFADAFPYLLLGEESLGDLNKRLDSPVPMNRFRPNLVFSGGNCYDEDTFDVVQAGEVVFKVAKPCGRCVITTVNQDTAEKGKEPLRTLATYRTVGNNIHFGQYLLLKTGGVVHLGDELVLLTKRLS